MLQQNPTTELRMRLVDFMRLPSSQRASFVNRVMSDSPEFIKRPLLSGNPRLA